MTVADKFIGPLLAAAGGLLLLLAATACSSAEPDSDQASATRNAQDGQIVARFTDGVVFSLTPVTATDYFTALAELRPEVRNDYVWIFAGQNPDYGIARLAVEFQPAAEDTSWDFLQARLTLSPGTDITPEQRVEELYRLLEKRLGPPSYQQTETEGEALYGWSLPGQGDVLLHYGRTDTLDSVVLEAALAQGEGEG